MCYSSTSLIVGVISAVALSCTGCQTTHNGQGIVFGCDGSGAGVLIKWGPPVRKGLRDGGYRGVFSPYRWQTGLGVAADHLSKPAYKRSAAEGLAKKIAQHHALHPGDPIYVGGLSADCAVVLYALEQLPERVRVEQVVLLSSSVSADYDLTRALRRIHGKLFAFTSSRDQVLSSLVSNVGTADGRPPGTAISGLRGFSPPARATTQTKSLYAAKVKNIAWRPEFARHGHNGGHTDVVNSTFVKKYVAPLMVPSE